MLSGILSIIVMVAIYVIIFMDSRQQCPSETRDVKYMLNRGRVFKLNKHTT